jgi:protocatechuate 3,4-dioxygenase, beta subunit
MATQPEQGTVYRRPGPDVHPPALYEGYRSTVKRAPRERLVFLPHTLSEQTGPVYGHDSVRQGNDDLTRQHPGEPLGERIIVTGQVRDDDGRPVRNTLVEIWQANAAGRYRHHGDNHPAPLDPNFGGAGRTMTDENGFYRFVTVKPGAYPWLNHPNAWRPAHIHFSLFGPAFATRLITQMYFPWGPALRLRPDLPVDPRRASAEAPDLAFRSGQHDTGVGTRLPVRHRAARPGFHSPGDLR